MRQCDKTIFVCRATFSLPPLLVIHACICYAFDDFHFGRDGTDRAEPAPDLVGDAGHSGENVCPTPIEVDTLSRLERVTTLPAEVRNDFQEFNSFYSS